MGSMSKLAKALWLILKTDWQPMFLANMLWGLIRFGYAKQTHSELSVADLLIGFVIADVILLFGLAWWRGRKPQGPDGNR